MTTHARTFRAARLAAAFSLIEVLIAILILALGLLGLGAVIPVVVREQRVASESTRAVIAANNAKAYLEARPDLNRLVGGSGSRGGGPSIGGASSVQPMGFGVWLENLEWSSEYLWAETTESWDVAYRGSGDLRFRGTGQRMTIPMVDRLWPDPSSGADPLLVWDFAARRVTRLDALQKPVADKAERTLEIVVFVRRIDPAIRVQPGQTRLQVLTDTSLPASQRRLPVSIDPASGPTGDGRTPSSSPPAEYSMPITLEVALATTGRRDIVILNTDGKAPKWAVDAAARPGQKLVDNGGNIYTVLRRADTGSDPQVVVSPPIPITSQSTQFQRVVFTPQVPAAVQVFRITIPVSPAQSPNGSGAGMSPWYGEVGQQP